MEPKTLEQVLEEFEATYKEFDKDISFEHYSAIVALAYSHGAQHQLKEDAKQLAALQEKIDLLSEIINKHPSCIIT